MLKNKIQLSKFEDLVGIFKLFMKSGSIPSSDLEEHTHGLYKIEGLYREEGGAKEPLKGKRKDYF